MNLNGWQRLWIVYSILLFLGIVVVFSISVNSDLSLYHGRINRADNTRLQSTLISILEKGKAESKKEKKTKDYNDYSTFIESIRKFKKDSAWEWDQENYMALWLRSKMKDAKANGVSSESLTDNYVTLLRSGKRGKNMDFGAIDVAYQLELKNAKKRFQESVSTAIWTSLLFWIVPIAFSYGLGWSIAWIRRGFKGDES